MGIPMVGETWVQHRFGHRIHTRWCPDRRSACPLVQPTWHWQPCPTSTRPTTTSSDGMHRFHSQRPTATWLSLLPADDPTYTMNSQEEAGPRHHVGTTHQGDMSLHRDQLSSESIHRQLQHQPHRPIHGFPKRTTGKKTHGQEPNENMQNNKKLEPRPKLHRQLLLMRLQNQTLVPLWHPPSSRRVNIGLNKLQSPEPLRPSARLPAPPSRAYLPVSQHLPMMVLLNRFMAVCCQSCHICPKARGWRNQRNHNIRMPVRDRNLEYAHITIKYYYRLQTLQTSFYFTLIFSAMYKDKGTHFSLDVFVVSTFNHDAWAAKSSSINLLLALIRLSSWIRTILPSSSVRRGRTGTVVSWLYQIPRVKWSVPQYHMF